mgnify:CR=1 FL=1
MSARKLELQHAKLGSLSISSEDIIHFEGLPGFPGARRFALVGHDKGQEFAWLASCDDLELALPVVSMRSLWPELCGALSDDDLASVGAATPEEVEVLAIVNLSEMPPKVNGTAPVLIHLASRRGSQVLIDPATSFCEPDVAQIESKPQT